jgi:glycosyltransferase involved in cell wall biosynthesis
MGMMDGQAITWLMPIKNGMPYLRLTLESIAGQTYKHAHKIIVWDNGSSDGTLEELRRWIPARVDGVVVSGKPLSLGRSLAALTEMADTELCARIDGDDICHPRRLEEQVAFLAAHPEVGLLGCQVEVIDEHGRPTDERGWVYPTADAELRWMTRWHSQFCHPALLFRKSAVLEAGNYQDAQPFEDLDLAMRMAGVTEFANLPERLLKYRRVKTSSTGTVSEFLPLDRSAARKNVGTLFPNIQNERRAMELWEATHPRQWDMSCRVRHMGELKTAARRLAEAVGKPGNYFTSTQVYRNQLYALKARAYRKFGLMPLVMLKAQLAHAGSAGSD